MAKVYMSMRLYSFVWMCKINAYGLLVLGIVVCEML